MTVEENRLAGRRILIVEDNFNTAFHVARLLKAQGAEVAGPVATISAALTMVGDTERIDNAVLDINLGGSLIYPVVDGLRSEGVPVVFMTGYDPGAVVPGYGDIPCLQKPLTIAHLVEAIGVNTTSTRPADRGAASFLRPSHESLSSLREKNRALDELVRKQANASEGQDYSAKAPERYQCFVTDANGRLLGRHDFIASESDEPRHIARALAVDWKDAARGELWHGFQMVARLPL